MTDYNIKSGDPTTIETCHKFKTYKFHPYGLSSFRQDILDFIAEKKGKGLSYGGYDNLTHAWRTPWDTHQRYYDLMVPLNSYVTSVAKQLSPSDNWYHHDAWIAHYQECSAANIHNHGQTLGWSYCYYVKVPDDGPGILLKDDVDNDFYNINVTDGDILFFRSFINHQVMPSIGERVVIAGNIRMLDTDYLQLEKDNSALDADDWTNSFV